MKGSPITYKNLIIYPEHCGIPLDHMLSLSKTDSKFRIGTTVEGNNNGDLINVARVVKEGKVLYTRAKHRLFENEVEASLQPGEKPETVVLPFPNFLRLLPLICYELMFPEDYLNLQPPPNVIVHMVGFPMFDENQKEAWLALQKSLTIVYNCPLICCCGGKPGLMNITGIMEP